MQGISCSWSMGCCDRSVTFLDEYQIFHLRSTGKPVVQLLFKSKRTNSKCWWTVKCRLRCHKRTVFSRWIKCRSPTETRVQNYETRVQNTQSCVRWVVWQSQFGHQKPISNILTPKTQLADTLTEGNFTRDEWNHLLRLFKIRNFQGFPAAIFF